MGRFKDALLPQPPSFSKKKAYELHSELGVGAFGKVIGATWTHDGEKTEVALKVISKKQVKGNEAAVWSEMEVLKGLDHPNIVEFQAFGFSTEAVLKGARIRCTSTSGLSLVTSTTSHLSWQWAVNSSSVY
jgi:serine/threonine protein kinase